MPQPLVSVIVPAYNAAGFISRCVESITSQSYPELEILLLNDGSTDDTLAVCRKLAAADSRIRVVDKPNTGAADTRSCGCLLRRCWACPPHGCGCRRQQASGRQQGCRRWSRRSAEGSQAPGSSGM